MYYRKDKQYMSAIYGIINLQKVSIEKSVLDKMEQEYKSFKIDRFCSIIEKNAAFGTALQFIRKQSPTEILPYYDKKHQNLFTADCYLDNRAELIPELADHGQSIGITVDNNTPDGMLTYLSYLKWGKKLCDHLLGVFAIAIYDYTKNKFHLYVDHCGDRCVHYFQKYNTVYFSTIIRPIQAATEYTIAVSEKYISACESNLSPDMVLYPGLTPYEDVYQLLAGQHLVATNTGNKVSYTVKQYWNPIKTVKPLKLNSDDAYKKLFLDTYSKCVTDALDVDGKVGCFLSSGLDSSSVASLAALYLKEKGENLYSYTSIPMKDYLVKEGRRLENESIPVKKFCDHFGNIIPSFVSCEGKSALTELERFVRLFNSPIKYPINAVWLEEIYKQAAADGCKAILKGQHGNSSVSYGGLIIRMWFEFKSFHFATMFNQYKQFSHKMHVNKKMLLSAIAHEVFDYCHPKINLDEALTKTELLKKHKIREEYNRRSKLYGEENIHSNLQRKRSVFMPASFQQVSYANAHFELESGLIARDPTRDKRIIELCISMPISCFSDGFYERRLITDFMKDIIPPHIIHQMYNRGIQSADYIDRIQKYTQNTTNYISILSDNILLEYLDTDKLEKLVFDYNNNLNLISSIYALSLYFFLHQ